MKSYPMNCFMMCWSVHFLLWELFNYLWPCVCHKGSVVEFNVYILMSKQHGSFSAGIFLPVSTQNMIQHISLSTQAPSSVSFSQSCLSFMEYGYLGSTNTDKTNWILDLQPTLDLHLPVSSDHICFMVEENRTTLICLNCTEQVGLCMK